jgi:hypothetical protein
MKLLTTLRPQEVALWLDIGTVAHFRNLTVTR